MSSQKYLLGRVDLLLEFFAVAQWVMHIVVDDAIDSFIVTKMALVVTDA